MDPSTKPSLEEIFQHHLNGKIGLKISKSVTTQRDLSIAYTPGVSEVCKAIEKDPSLTYSHTCKGNLVAVVTDGTAVLGLGNIGAKASIPVMEGKALLFKAFANVDAWPITIENASNLDGTTNVEKFVEITKSIAGYYGGINLEDIAAPACFAIEEMLDKALDIPVFHDDQWGTAIIVLAALFNYCEITSKKMKNLKVVINGAGAAGIRIADLLKDQGVSHCILCDRKGVIHTNRKDLNTYKQKHSFKTDAKELADAMVNSDIFIGVSSSDLVKAEMVKSMNHFPGIFAMANPNPEIKPELVHSCMKGLPYIMATGRSDYPNQINNVLGFPFIFRGALDVRATTITMNMKVAAAKALAQLAREKEIPLSVKKAYGRDFSFGPSYIVPTPFDPRINQVVPKAVREAAIKDKVARVDTIKDSSLSIC